MSNVRSRVRGSTSTPQQNPQEQETGWYDEAEDGFSKSEQMRSSNKYQPSRFWLRVGEEADIIILDDAKGFFIHEYEIYTPATKRVTYETVRPDTEYDPLQQLVGVDPRFKDPAYVMYLTCLDLREFTDKNGNVRYYAKKLLPVKRIQHKKFKRYLEQHGTFRGMMLRMIRDEQKQSKIGDPEFQMADAENGKALFSEEDLLENFGHDAVVGSDGKTVIKKKDEDCEPFDYRKVLAPKSQEELARTYNAPLQAGSEASNRQAMSAAPEQTQQRSAPASNTQRPSILSRRKPSDDSTDAKVATPSRRVAPTQSDSKVEDSNEEPPFDIDDGWEENQE